MSNGQLSGEAPPRGAKPCFQLILKHNGSAEAVAIPAQRIAVSPYLLRKSKAHRQVELSYNTIRNFNEEVKAFLLYGHFPQFTDFLDDDDVLRLSILFCVLDLHDIAKQIIYQMKGTAFNQLKRKKPT